MGLRAIRPGAAPGDRLAAALALAAAAPAARWSLIAAAPTGGAPDLVGRLLLAGLAIGATAAILRLARSATRRN
jgi:tripartite-type tricarboxylate transporter receptor subunit TctC